MVYVIYFLAVLYVVMSFAMLYVAWRSRLFGLFLMGITYGTSGLLAMMLPHWWPLAAGFVLAWLLRALGLEPRVEAPADNDKADGGRRQAEERPEDGKS